MQHYPQQVASMLHRPRISSFIPLWHSCTQCGIAVQLLAVHSSSVMIRNTAPCHLMHVLGRCTGGKHAAPPTGEEVVGAAVRCLQLDKLVRTKCAAAWRVCAHVVHPDTHISLSVLAHGNACAACRIKYKLSFAAIRISYYCDLQHIRSAIKCCLQHARSASTVIGSLQDQVPIAVYSMQDQMLILVCSTAAPLWRTVLKDRQMKTACMKQTDQVMKGNANGAVNTGICASLVGP
eukprot:1147858-Pelagomonas_calceolata.AAC.5